MHAALCLAGEDFVTCAQPGVGSEFHLGRTRDAEVERAGHVAAAEHPLGGNGLRQADEAKRNMRGYGLHGPRDVLGEVEFRRGNCGRAFPLCKPEVWSQPAEGDEQE